MSPFISVQGRAGPAQRQLRARQTGSGCPQPFPAPASSQSTGKDAEPQEKVWTTCTTPLEQTGTGRDGHSWKKSTEPPAQSPFPRSFSVSLQECVQKAREKQISRLPRSRALSGELPMRWQLRAPARAPTPLSGHLSHSSSRAFSCNLEPDPNKPPNKKSSLSFLSLHFLPPCDFFPCCCLQGERGQRHQNERFSCAASPSSGPNSFFMAPCSDKSHCFSPVSVRRAISQS